MPRNGLRSLPQRGDSGEAGWIPWSAISGFSEEVGVSCCLGLLVIHVPSSYSMGTFVVSHQVAPRMPSQFSKPVLILNPIYVSLWTREKLNSHESDHKKNEVFF